MYDCAKSNFLQSQSMSLCSEWIRDWLRRSGKSQSELASLGGVDPANVSRWINGQSRPDREAIGRFALALPHSEGTALMIAWLKDLLPEGADERIQIEPVLEEDDGCELREDTPPYQAHSLFPPAMGIDLRERLLFFGKLALENPDIRKILDVCYQAAVRNEKNNKLR